MEKHQGNQAETRIWPKDIEKLWIETFHDSEEYVELLFGKYYNPTYCLEERTSEGELKASLTAIPYAFETTGGDSLYRGLYLCGLATRPHYRRQGIMQRLLERIERIARQEGYDLLFLIPASAKLADYYRRLGFHKDLPRTLIEVPSDHPAPQTKESTQQLQEASGYTRKQPIASEDNHRNFAAHFPKSTDSRDYAKWSQWERALPGLHLRHSPGDFETIAHEARLSGNPIHATEEAVAFCEHTEEETVIRQLLGTDTQAMLRLLAKLRKQDQGATLRLTLSPDHPIATTLADEGLQDHTSLYGQAKILKKSENSQECENRKKSTDGTFNRKFSILANDHISISLLLD